MPDRGPKPAAIRLTRIAAWIGVSPSSSSCVFGWSGGKALVESSYADAKVKSRELKAKRKQG